MSELTDGFSILVLLNILGVWFNKGTEAVLMWFCVVNCDIIYFTRLEYKIKDLPSGLILIIADQSLTDLMCCAYTFNVCVVFCRLIGKLLLWTFLTNLFEIGTTLHELFWIKLKPNSTWFWNPTNVFVVTEVLDLTVVSDSSSYLDVSWQSLLAVTPGSHNVMQSTQTAC